MGTLQEYGGYLHDSVIQCYSVDIEGKTLSMELLLEPAPAMGREEEYQIFLQFEGMTALRLDNGETYNVIFEMREYTPEELQTARAEFMAKHWDFSAERIREIGKNNGRVYELCASVGLNGYIAAEKLTVDIIKRERQK